MKTSLIERIKSFSRVAVMSAGLAGILSGVGGCMTTGADTLIDIIPLTREMKEQAIEHRNYEPKGNLFLIKKDGSAHAGWWRYNTISECYEDVEEERYARVSYAPIRKSVSKDEFAGFTNEVNFDEMRARERKNQRDANQTSNNQPNIQRVEPEFFSCNRIEDYNRNGLVEDDEITNRKNIFSATESLAFAGLFPAQYTGQNLSGRIIRTRDRKVLSSFDFGKIESPPLGGTAVNIIQTKKFWDEVSEMKDIEEYVVEWELDNQLLEKYAFIVKK